MRRLHVARGWADGAYIGRARTKGVKDNDCRNIWTSRSRRNCSSAGGSSAVGGGRSATVHSVSCGCGRQRDNVSGGARGAAADVGASASAAQPGSVSAANRDTAGDKSERGAELFGNTGCGAKIAKRVARTSAAGSGSRNGCVRMPLRVTDDKKCGLGV